MSRTRLSGVAAASAALAALGGAGIAHGEALPQTTPAPPPATTTDEVPVVVGADPAPTKPKETRPPAATPPADGEPPAVVGAPTEADRERSRTRRAESRAKARAEKAEEEAAEEAEEEREEAERDGLLTGDGRNPDGTPTGGNPGLSLAMPGAAPIGVPNFFIDKFRIPPFLLPIYQAAGIEYGVRWEVLAAINEIETDYGRNLNVSSAGALGWMQFMPPSWKAFGVDANDDGKKDPYNPVDAIFAAARYLAEHGAATDLRKAIFAYNHADWYVDSVLMRARLIGGLPTDLIGSLTGLTQGHFPVHAPARYADDLTEKDAERRVAKGRNAAMPVESSATRRGVNIFADAGSPVIAVQDGTVVRIGRSKRLGRFLQLRDTYGNTYTYARLGEIASSYPVARGRGGSDARGATQREGAGSGSEAGAAAVGGEGVVAELAGRLDPSEPAGKQRIHANPQAAGAQERGGPAEIGLASADYDPVASPLGLDRDDVRWVALREGSRVIAGTQLGRIGEGTRKSGGSRVLFEIRPAGRGAPRIDPKPILDGWKLLESTAVYRARGENVLSGLAGGESIGQILLLSKEALQKRVLEDTRIEIYECGREDIAAGAVDRRVLAGLAFLSASGLRPTVSSLRCGRSGRLTVSGNVSQHVTGSAVDISRINGLPVLGNQGPGSVTEQAVRRLATLQGTMKPHQIISLITVDGADNTVALPDHADHLHIGWRPIAADSRLGAQLATILKPAQWERLLEQIASIANPEVATTPSASAIPADPPARAERP
jgi:hypothetical protein